jgi:predicted ester cyclase
MASRVLAHQVRSEGNEVIERSSEDYAEHVREMVECYGAFEFAVEELLADGDKVYARWRQRGRHMAEIDGYPPTQESILEVASCVYRVEAGKIVEYWIEIDRAGLAAQLKRSAST